MRRQTILAVSAMMIATVFGTIAYAGTPFEEISGLDDGLADPYRGLLESLNENGSAAAALLVGADDGTDLDGTVTDMYDSDGDDDPDTVYDYDGDGVSDGVCIILTFIQTDYVYDGADAKDVEKWGKHDPPKWDVTDDGQVKASGSLLMMDYSSRHLSLCPNPPAPAVRQVTFDLYRGASLGTHEFDGDRLVLHTGSPDSLSSNKGQDAYKDPDTRDPPQSGNVTITHWDSDAEPRLGEHLVVRSENQRTSDQYPERPFMFNNVHLLSGNVNPALHDLDNDSHPDTAELQAGSNPLNDRSWPGDYDGDGHGDCPTPPGSCPDAYPRDESKFRDFDWTPAVTSPAAGATVRGTVSIGWSVTPKKSSPVPLKTVEITLVRGTARHLLASIPYSPTQTSAVSGTTPWNTLALPAAYSSTVDQDGGWAIEIKAHDEGTGSPLKDPLNGEATRSLSVLNFPSPAVSAPAVGDANGQRDDASSTSPGALAGSVYVNFTATDKRGGSSLGTFKYKVDVGTCPATSGVNGTMAIPGTLANAAPSNNSQISVFFSAAQLAPLNSTASGPKCGTTYTDAAATIHVEEVVPGQPPRKTTQLVHFNYFNNRKPVILSTSATPLKGGNRPVSQVDAADTVSEGSQVEFAAFVRDPDFSCTGGRYGSAPSQVHVVVSHSVTGQRLVEGDLAATPTYTASTRCSTTAINSDYASTGGVRHDVTLDVPPGPYRYNISVLDAHGNKQDGNNSLVFKNESAFKNAPAPAAPQVCPADQPAADCLLAKINEEVGEAEDDQDCDIAVFGNDDHDKPCTDKPVDALLSLIGSLQDEVTNISNELEKNLRAVGPPNPYDLTNCDLGSCAPGDHDRDGDLSNYESQTGTDPYNPYSNRGDRDADLIPNALETFLDIHLWRMSWVNKSASDEHPCGQADRQSDCRGLLVRVPHAGSGFAVYDSQSLEPSGRRPVLFNLTFLEGDQGVARIGSNSENVCYGATPATTAVDGRYDLTCGGYSWTLVGGVVQGPRMTGCDTIPTCQVYGRLNAWDAERGVEFWVNMSALDTPGKNLLDVKVLGPRSGNATVGTARGGGPTPTPPKDLERSFSVSTDPFMVLVDRTPVHQWYFQENETLRVESGESSNAPWTCGKQGNTGPGSPTGTWVKAQRNADGSWTICSNSNNAAPTSTSATKPVTVPSVNALDANYPPYIGAHPTADGYQLWADKDPENRQFDKGEELGPPVKPGGVPCASAPCVEDTFTKALGCGTGVDASTCAGNQTKNAPCQSETDKAKCLEKAAAAKLCPSGSNASMEACIVFTMGCGKDKKFDVVDDCLMQKVIDQVNATSGGKCADNRTLQGCANIVPLPSTDLDGDDDSTQAELLAGCPSNPVYKKSNTKNGGGCFPDDYDGDGYSNMQELSPGPGYRRSDPFHACSYPKPYGVNWFPTDPQCTDT